jgi:hypothetical protein
LEEGKLKDKGEEFVRPIFIGGTGRSGTSIMANLISSHPDVVLPAHENKLIAERYGLISLIEELSGGFDWKSNHETIKNFIYWSSILRKQGFHNKSILLLFKILNKTKHIFTGKGLSVENFCRKFPDVSYSLHAIGIGYGYEHYDRCIESFLSKIIDYKDCEGIFDTQGVVRPFYTPSTFDRNILISYSQEFLQELYRAPMRIKDATRWCDDTPINVSKSKFLTELFPECSIIHMVRDPRDVLSSYLTRSWSSSDFSTTLKRLCLFYENLIEVEQGNCSKNIITVKLEDFVSNYDAECSIMLKKLNLKEDGFNFSTHLNSDSFGRWEKDLNSDMKLLALKEFKFAFDYFGYE